MTFTEHLPSDQSALYCARHHCQSYGPGKEGLQQFYCEVPPWSLRGELSQKCPFQTHCFSKRPTYPSCAALRPRAFWSLTERAVTVPACWPALPSGARRSGSGMPCRVRGCGGCSVPWGAVSPSPGLTLGPSLPLGGPVDHHGPDHRLHPDGAGEVRVQAQRAPALRAVGTGCV